MSFSQLPDSKPAGLLRLGEAEVDLLTLRVQAKGEHSRLTPRTLAVLLQLARAPQQTCTRRDLLDGVWSDSTPTPDVLSQAIRELRRVFGDSARTPEFIETLHGIGYRLIPTALFLEREVVPPGTDAPMESAVQDRASTDVIAAAAPDMPSSVDPVVSAPRAWRTVAALLGALAALIVLMRWNASPPAAPQSALRIEGAQTLLTSDPGAEEFPRLSPDGRRVAYTSRVEVAGRFDLRVREVERGESLELTATPEIDELLPEWSPDGQWIAYTRVEGTACTVERIPAAGGESRRLAPCDRVVFGSVSWAPDGSHLVAALPSAEAGREPRLHRVALDGSAPVPITYQLTQPGWDRDPAYSPDGRWIAFRRGVPPDYDLFVIPAADGGAARRLTTHGRVGEGIAWTPDGRQIVFSREVAGQPALYAVDLASGESQPLQLPAASRPHLAAGRMVFQRLRSRVEMVSVPLAPDMPSVPVAASTGSVRLVAGSPAGDRVAYLSDRAGLEELWIVRLSDGQTRSYPHPQQRRVGGFDWHDDGRSLLVVLSDESQDSLATLDLESGEYHDLGLSRPLLRDPVHGRDADEIYAIVRRDDRSVAGRFVRDPNGQWRQFESNVAVTELIRVPGVAGALGRTMMRPAEVVQLGSDLSERWLSLQPRVYAFAGFGGDLWYVSSARRAHAELRRFSLTTGEDVAIRDLPHQFPRRRATIGVGPENVVLPLLVEDRTDVGLVKLTGMTEDVPR